jgi:cytochrome c-type biogenesis protein CcmH
VGAVALAGRADRALRAAGRSRAGWAVLGLVLVVALAAGVRVGSGVETTSQRVDHIAAEVRCPSCEGLSVLESDAPTALAVRSAIRRMVAAGSSDSEVEGYLVSRYGSGILLRPGASGFEGLVWILPIVVLVVVAAALTAVFWRRRRRASVALVPADVERVARAREGGGGGR